MSRYSSNPFHSDSDSDSVNCFVTDLFESHRSSSSSDHPPPPRRCSCHDISINPFSGAICDLHHHRPQGFQLGFDFDDEFDTQNHDQLFDFSVGAAHSTGGLRVVGFGSDSDSSGDEGGNIGGERVEGGFDEFDVRLCWDSLCLEDQRNLNEWEEVVEESRLNERELGSTLVIDEVGLGVGVEVDDQSVASGFEEEDEEEEGFRHLEWEILVAVNNLEMDVALHHEVENSFDEGYLTVHEYDSFIPTAFQDGFISTADYEVLFGQLLQNESGLKGSPPAAKSFVESLPLVELTEEELRGKDMACAICKDEIMLEEKVRRLPCSHCYHGDCILPWLSIRNTCPVCRFELPTDDPDYEQSKIEGAAAHGLMELATEMQF